jgi:hypothetical protein
VFDILPAGLDPFLAIFSRLPWRPKVMTSTGQMPTARQLALFSAVRQQVHFIARRDRVTVIKAGISNGQATMQAAADAWSLRSAAPFSSGQRPTMHAEAWPSARRADAVEEFQGPASLPTTSPDGPGG